MSDAERRPPGEGSVFQRGDGRWVAQLTTGYLPGGKRRRASRTARSEAEALKKLRELEGDLDQGISGNPRLTTAAWLKRWLQEEAKPTVRPRTYASYESVVRLYLIPGLGHIPLRKLGPAEVRAFLNAQAEAGHGARWVQHQHAVLRRALEVATRYGLVVRNVARLVSPPRVRRPEIRPWTAEQARWFLEGSRTNRFEALFMLAMALGCRQSELLGLTWDDVDVDGPHPAITIKRSLQRYDGAYHLDDVKTVRSRRSLGLAPTLVDALKRQRDRQDFERKRLEDRAEEGREEIEDGSDAEAGRWGNEWSLVFTTDTGAPLSGPVVTKMFRRAIDRITDERARKLGRELKEEERLPVIRFHDLRHGMATYMLAQGVPLRVAMEALGHSQLSTTSDIYQHVDRQVLDEATTRVASQLFGAG